MESNSINTASITPIPSTPQVRILPFPHHSMLLLSNHTSDAKAVTSNPHLLFLLSLTNRLDDYKPLNTQSINRQLPHHFKQGSTHSISSETTDYGRSVWRVESRNLWVSFSRNASGSLIDIVHLPTDRVVGELRTLTSHAGLLPHHSSGEEKSDGPTARSRFIRKIVGTHGRRYLNSGMLTETVGDEDGIAGGAGEGMARNGMERMIGSRERDDPWDRAIE